MSTWIVTWVVVMFFVVPCPESKPTEDKFGVASPSNTTLSIACCKMDIKDMTREFTSKEEAIAFIKEGDGRCKQQGYQLPALSDSNNCELRDFKLYEKREVAVMR